MSLKTKSILSLGISAFLSAVMAITASAQIRLPKLITNGMVLQRNTKDRIWGWASPGEKVTIRFHGQIHHTTTGKNGEWSVKLSPMKAGGPFAMEIDGKNHIRLKNIMIGDVWLCSGQSNMVLPLSRVRPRYKKVIAHSENSKIREFIVPNRYNFKAPQKNLQSGSWEETNPWSILHFSATSYFFARALYRKYHVPIGLINASVGGTPVSAWMSRQALQNFPKYLKRAEKFSHKSTIKNVEKEDATNRYNWDKKAWNNDKGLNGKIPWYKNSYNDSAWPTMKLPAYWTNEGLKHVHGVVWFRKTFNVPAYMTGIPAKLFLGRIVDGDYAYVNGVLVGSISYQFPPRIYNIAPSLLKPGKNTITLRIINYSGKGGFIKDKPYKIVAGGFTKNLKGEWKYKVGYRAHKQMPTPTFIQYQPEGLFNGMIAPLVNYTIKGAIWYQGESNTGIYAVSSGLPSGYHQRFTAMIKDWRHKWGEGNFPFIYVQLPNYGTPVTNPSNNSKWAEVREAQLKTLSLPNTGMAIAIDVGEWNDVHPLDKGDIGNRLALVARKVAYGNNHIIYSGPLYKSMKIDGNKATITFSHVGKGLIVRNGKSPKYFAIAGANKHYVWAKARIEGKDKVVVWSPKVRHPKYVRYAWADDPLGVNLYNSAKLPAAPFRASE